MFWLDYGVKIWRSTVTGGFIILFQNGEMDNRSDCTFPFHHFERVLWIHPSSVTPTIFHVSIQFYEQQINPYFRSHIWGLFFTLFAVPSLVLESLFYFVHTIWPFSFYLAYNYCVSTRRWGACPTPSAVHAWCSGVLLIIINNTLTKHLADHFEYLWKRVWECSVSNTNKVEIHLLNSE